MSDHGQRTPRPVIDAVVRSVCGREGTHLRRLTSGGLNETYRAELPYGATVIVRISRQPEPWFTDEQRLMARARAAGVPSPEVLGVEQVEHDGELLSFSIQRLAPGRPLEELTAELSPQELDRLVMDGGELLARVHSLAPDGGFRHQLQMPAENLVARVADLAGEAFGAAAVVAVHRGADRLREEVTARPAPRVALTQGDWLPKHLLIDRGAIVGVIDWELGGSAAPAFDLARWEVSAGDPFWNHSEHLWRGYARVADPEAAADGWVPGFAIDWALEQLGWRNPAPLAQQRRCVDVIARYASV